MRQYACDNAERQAAAQCLNSHRKAAELIPGLAWLTHSGIRHQIWKSCVHTLGGLLCKTSGAGGLVPVSVKIEGKLLYLWQYWATALLISLCLLRSVASFFTQQFSCHWNTQNPSLLVSLCVRVRDRLRNWDWHTQRKATSISHPFLSFASFPIRKQQSASAAKFISRFTP